MRAFSSARRGRCSAPACRNAQQRRRHVAAGSAAVSRRSGLLAVGGAILTASSSTPALADGELATLTTLYGLASPPTSYGGYGGNSKEDFKYKFDYPEDWKRLTVNKVQKGTQGIDCIVQEGRNKKARAFVVTLARAGEDNKSFRLTDLDQTFQSFVGADYDLQDAVGSAEEIKSASRDEAGQQFYDYVVEGSEAVYMASITVAYGKVFALFVSTPARQYKANEATMRAMIQSFRTI